MGDSFKEAVAIFKEQRLISKFFEFPDVGRGLPLFMIRAEGDLLMIFIFMDIGCMLPGIVPI